MKASDGKAVAALAIVAFAMRLPYLMLLPTYKDEGTEALWALAIARGQHLPLTGSDAYYGPFFSYLLAGLFRVFGPSVELPRVVVAVAGALTVPAVYWLARELTNRTAALVAAALTLTSPILVTYDSHHGWSSSFVPLLATLTVAAFHAGLVRRQHGLLILSGFLAALTLQAHPTTVLLLAGLAIWVMSDRALRPQLLRSAGLVAGAVFAVTYLPMILANVRAQSPMVEQAKLRAYAFSPTLAPGDYFSRLIGFGRTAAAAIGGILPPVSVAAIAVGVITVAGVLFGLALGWRAGQRLLAIVFVTIFSCLPLFVISTSHRYYAAMIPLSYVAIGLLAADVASRLQSPRTGFGRITVAIGWLTAIAVVAFPIVTVARYDTTMAARGETNAPYFQFASAIRTARVCGPDLVVEDRPEEAGAETYPGMALRTLHAVLALSGCTHVMRDVAGPAHAFSPGAHAAAMVVADEDIERYAPHFSLELMSRVAVPVFEGTASIGVYRVTGLR